MTEVNADHDRVHREEIVESNPARAVASPKLEKYLPAWLDRKQVDVLFDMAELRAKEGEFADVRNLAIIELFYSTGMRLSELRGVNRGDLDLVAQQVKVRGKGDNRGGGVSAGGFLDAHRHWETVSRRHKRRRVEGSLRTLR